MDTVTPDVRSRIMASIRGKDTAPEMAVRRRAHAMGFRFRLHRRDLPGSPDLVFPRLRLCLFVHGCFWHRHAGCRAATIPRSNAAFWEAKFDRNVERDTRSTALLRQAGWNVEIVWGCDALRPDRLTARLEEILPVRSSALSRVRTASRKPAGK